MIPQMRYNVFCTLNIILVFIRSFMQFKFKTPESIITEVDAASILGLSPYTLRSWRQQARSPLAFYKIGGAIRYKENEVLALLSNSRVPQALEVSHEPA